MNITVTHTIHPDVISLLQSFINNVGGQVETAPKQKTKTIAAATSAPATQTDDVSKNGAEAKLTIEKVRAIVQQKSQAGKRAEIKKTLEEFETDSVSNLKPENYEAFVAKIQAL
jgi:hypothetical protein